MAYTDPQLVAFCNAQTRVLADVLTAMELKLQPYLDEYQARDIGNLVAAGDPAETIEDGAATDGRPIVTGNDCLLMVNLVNSLKAFWDGANKQVIYSWQVNGTRQ